MQRVQLRNSKWSTCFPDDQSGVVVSVWHSGTGACDHLFLTDERPVHGAGSVVPAADRYPFHHLCFHNVATVLVDVVVGLAILPKTSM